ncbi:hypothetical protein M0805_006029 [Coniferiporia weirii]|nr:hypothetical protein M0805_006029 [Coniferiporia weirii]
MANPRQRRKTRSSSHKPVKQSRRTNKLLKKQPPINGPKVLQDAWDKHKTVRQNYAALGLAHSLAPTDSGGQEMTRVHAESGTAGKDKGMATEMIDNERERGKREGKPGIPRGYGRIVRDESGAIVDVVLEEEVSADGDEAAAGVAAGRPGRVAGIGRSALEMDWLLGHGDAKRADLDPDIRSKEVLRALDAVSATGTRRARTTSEAELKYLERLIAAHGQDYEGMARDRRRNVQQYSAGQIGRAVSKAGLV